MSKYKVLTHELTKYGLLKGDIVEIVSLWWWCTINGEIALRSSVCKEWLEKIEDN